MQQEEEPKVVTTRAMPFCPKAHTSIYQFYWEYCARAYSRFDTVQTSLFIYGEMYAYSKEKIQLKERYGCEPNAKMLAMPEFGLPGHD